MGSKARRSTQRRTQSSSVANKATGQSNQAQVKKAGLQRGGQGSMDADGMALGGTLSQVAKTGPGASRTTTLRSDGGLKVTRTPVDGSDPQSYEVVTTITLGGAVGTDSVASTPAPKKKKKGEKKPKRSKKSKGKKKPIRPTNSRNASATAQVTGTFEQRRIVSESELEQLLDDLDAASGGVASSSFAEVKVLAGEYSKWSGVADQAQDIMEQLSGDPEGARGLAAGDGFSVTLEVGASGALGAGRTTATHQGQVSAEASASFSKVLKVDREGPKRMVVSIGFVSTTKLAASAGGGYGKSSMSARAMSEDSSSETFRFAFNPEAPGFDGDYRAVTSAQSSAALQGLTAFPFKSGGPLSAQLSASDVDGHGATADYMPGMSLAHNVEASTSEKVNVNFEENDVTGEVQGDYRDSVDLSIAGMSFGSEEGSRVKGKVESDGQASVDLDHDRDGMLSHTKLSRSDFDSLVGRSAKKDRWQGHAVNAPRVMSDWLALRSGLRSPALKAMEARVDPVAARELGQLRALSRFIKDAGNRGMTVLERCLNFDGDVLGYQSGKLSFYGGDNDDDWDAVVVKGEELADEMRTKFDELQGSEAAPTTWGKAADSYFRRVQDIGARSSDLLLLIGTIKSGRTMADMISKTNSVVHDVTSTYARLSVESGEDDAARAKLTEQAVETVLGNRIMDLENGFYLFRKEESRLLDKAINVYDDAYFDATGRAQEAMAPVHGMYLRWKVDLEEYRDAKRSMNPDQDRTKLVTNSYDQHGPRHNKYNNAVDYILPSNVRGYQKRMQRY